MTDTLGVRDLPEDSPEQQAKDKPAKKTTERIECAIWPGEIKGHLTREEIYEDK